MTEAIVSYIVDFINSAIPVFNFSVDYLNMIDNAMSTLLDIVSASGFFLPLDVLVVCYTTMLIVDNFAIIVKIVQFVIKLIRG